MTDDRTKAFEYRQCAEELRRLADGMRTEDARKKLMNAAEAYEGMADKLDPLPNSN